MTDVKKWWVTRDGAVMASDWAERIKQRDLLYQAIGVATLSLMGLLLPRAVIYGGCAPLGVALSSAVGGVGGITACIFSVIGYLLPSDVVFPLRYIAAVSLVFGVRWALSGWGSLCKKDWLAPLLAGGSLFVTGMAIGSVHGFQWDVCFTQLCEAALGAGFAWFYRQGVRLSETGERQRSLSVTEQMSLVVLAASLLMALDHIVFSGISVGRILTMLLILLAAKSGQEYGGMISGILLGAATALCMPDQLHAAVSFAVGGLMAGTFARFGRILTALLFGGVHVFVLLATGDAQTVAVGAYEWLAAALLFIVLPSSAEVTAKTLFCRSQALPAAGGMKRSVELRLRYAANTMSDIAKTVDVVSDKLTAMEAPKLKSIYTDVCEHICNGCSGRDGCWKERFTDTMADFRQMGRVLREKGHLETADVPRTMTEHCRHHEDVMRSMNLGYAHLVSKEEACKRLSDMRGMVTDQFEGMASLLKELSDELQAMERTDEQTTAAVERVCRKYHLPLTQAVCLIGRRHRMAVELLLEGCYTPSSDSRWFREVCAVCGCDFEEPIVSQADFMTKIRLSEAPRLRVRAASAQCRCRSEKYCGDAVETFHDYDGRFCAIVSDGMGSGGRAAVDGAMTAALAGRMMRAGFHFDNILRIINSALVVKSREESSATLDAVQIDLFTGRVSGLKAGAAPSFMYSRGHVCRIASSSLPIGILPQVEASGYEEYLGQDDWLVLVSDGVVSDDSEWLETLIEKAVKAGDSEQALANDIVATATALQGAHSDDTTALVLRVC